MSTPTTSVIHDIGYKPYTGPRLGRPQILRALYVHGLRACLGFGRGPKAKIVPWFRVLIALIPAALNVYASSAGKPLVMPYSAMASDLFLFTALYTAVAAPELVSRDLRHHTLPLYFSRPLHRIDYPLAKVLALATTVFAILMLPVLITYIGQIASAKSGHEIWLDSRQAFPALVIAVLQAAVLSVLALLLASTTGRRVIATGLIAIFFLVTLAISHVMSDALGRTWDDHTVSCVVPTVDPRSAKAQNADQLFGIGGGEKRPPTTAVAQLCAGVDLRNDDIQGVDGTSDPNKSGYADITVHYQTPHYTSIAKAGGLFNPEGLVEGTRIWVFHATDSDQPDPSPLGPVYALELVLVVLAGTGGLFLRYRKVSVS